MSFPPMKSRGLGAKIHAEKELAKCFGRSKISTGYPNLGKKHTCVDNKFYPTYVEPENGPLEKEKHLQIINFQLPRLLKDSVPFHDSLYALDLFSLGYTGKWSIYPNVKLFFCFLGRGLRSQSAKRYAKVGKATKMAGFFQDAGDLLMII